MLTTEYAPKQYIIPTDGEDLDVDDSNDGDYIVCHKHNDVIVYVFGTNFWQKEGGESSYGWSSITVDGWCFKCRKHHKINCGSYGG